jgi:transposase
LSDTELISQQKVQLDSQSKEIQSLKEKVELLLDLLQKKGIKKDSHNSSLAPSSDLFTKNKSLRPVSERSSGGQKGHQGSTLTMTLTPDKIIELKSNFCSICGQSLLNELFILKAKRQVVEIPPMVSIYEEYRQYACHCPICNHQQVADFPLGVNAPIQYGSTVESLVSYFSVYQHIPFKRLQGMFSQVFLLPLSQGSIDNLLERTAQKCDGFYQKIKQQIIESPVVGSDETGAKVNGKKWWIWAWQNLLNTFIIASDNRGSKTVDEVFANGLPHTSLVSDRWAAQLKMNTKNHQICLAHLLRDLIYLEESEKNSFATQFKQVITDIFDLKKVLIQKQKACQEDSLQSMILEKKINDLLLLTIDKEKYPLTATFQISMTKHRNSILPCIYNLDIPPDNNGSERAIRNIKVKQKVSGQFKSGQSAYCVIRSVIDTLLKRRVELLSSLNQIIKLQPV